MDIIIDQLNNLELDYLDHGWITAIYQSEFLEFPELPDTYVSAIATVDLDSVFLDIINAADIWLSQATIEEKSWASLSNSIQEKKVLAILAYYINNGCENVLNKERRTYAILASRVYYKLLAIPGCKVYHIYHSQLFAQSLACLHFPLEMCDGKSNNRNLSREVNNVLIHLSEFVKDLTVVVEQLQLNPSDMNFEEIINNLVDITGYAIVDKLPVGPLQKNKLILGQITNLIYGILHTLLRHPTGESNEMALKVLFKCILPKLISASLDSKQSNKCIRPSYVTYSMVLLATHGKAALKSFVIVLERLCISPQGMERGETRDLRSTLIVGLMSSLPQTSFTEYVNFLIKCSYFVKLGYRQMALEVLAKLLEGEHGELETNETVDYNEPVAGCSHAPDPQTSDEEMDNQQPDVAEVPPVGEDTENLLHERKHKVKHVDILSALYDTTLDESATVRTRALVILTKCVNSNHVPLVNAIKHLNGNGVESRLMAVATRCTSDERAVVRKAAVTLLLHLLADERTPDPPEYQVKCLTSLCRDASVLVRISAITAVGDLLTERSSYKVMNAFLEGPLNRIADPETKVQDHALSVIEKKLINRLRQFTTLVCDDPMPWMIIEGIETRYKEKNLEKVCLMLSKSSNCINHRLVDKLSSHLGALDDQRDLHCLLLLNNVALHVEYPDVGFVLEYFYKLTRREKRHLPRLMDLTLDLLRAWSRFLTVDQRSRLRGYLMQRLATAQKTDYRINCALLASELDRDNVTWITEMMDMCVRRALSARDVREALRAADLSIATRDAPDPALLSLLLDVANAPPEGDAKICNLAVIGATRLCVRSCACAKVSAPVFAELVACLDQPLDVRVNSLLGLCDVGFRYTCVVEPLLGTISDCLSKDSPSMLRRMAARELTRLFLGQFLRLRTPLYFRYCALLADDDESVRHMVEYYLSFGLTVEVIHRHFVECLMHYNRDKKDPLTFNDRQLIYDIMLQRMTQVQKLNIQYRLGREVLEHAADLTEDSEEDLPQEINAVLLDTIKLFCENRMKITQIPPNQEELHHIGDLRERVTSNILSQRMKIQVVEIVGPAVLRLYKHLKSRGGQLNAYLLLLCTNLIRDYQHEIEDIFDDNEDLTEKLKMFKESIGEMTTVGNIRNLVTKTAPPEPDTPRAPRKAARSYRAAAGPPRKRTLRM